MKRREFLKSTTALAGTVLPPFAFSQSNPCPPNVLSVAGGNSATTLCSVNAESDWQSRISGPGVVWYHDFRSDAEVNRFRWQGGLGNDLNGTGDGNCRRIVSDGITGGGCLELNIPTGGICGGSWGRPFSPLTGATNGRGVDDPGANGTITRRAWNVVHATDYAGKWKNGYYAHNDYHNHATRGAPNGWGHEGNEFWLQFRVKMSASRGNPSNPDGKLAGILISGNGTSTVTPNQELVLMSRPDAFVAAYTNFGNRTNSGLFQNQSDPGAGLTGSYTPGGDRAATCQTYQDRDCTKCYCYGFDQWVTVLIHVIAGHDGGGGDNPPFPNTNNDTTMQIFIAYPGETTYRTVYNKSNYVWSFGENDSTPYGWNLFRAWAFMNGVPSAVGWYQRYDQIIFSRQPIPPPLV